MSEFVANISYATAFAAALMSLHLFQIRPVRRAPTFFLALTFLVICLQSFFFGLNLHFDRPNLSSLLLPILVLLIGPFSYFFFAAARKPRTKLPKTYWLHLIPSLIMLSELLSGIVLLDIDLTIIISLGFYTGLLLKMTFDRADQFAALGATKSQAYNWLLVCTALHAIGFITEILVSWGLEHGVQPTQTLLLPIVFVLKLLLIGLLVSGALQRSAFFEWIYTVGPKLQSVSRITGELEREFRSIMQKLDDELEAAPLTLENAPTLKEMAARLNIPIRHLSKAVNHLRAESYSRYMNRKRVERAKALIRDAPHSSITSIMYDAGFRTKSSFNREFLAIESVSPTVFRESLRKIP